MGTKESNSFNTTYRLSMPQDDGSPNNPLPPHWSPMKAFDNSGSTSTSFLNPLAAGSYFSNYALPEQGSGTPLQFGFLHDTMRLSNNPLVPREYRKKCNRSSMPKDDKDGMSLSGTSGSKESPVEGHCINHDFPLNVKQQHTVMLGNSNSIEQNQNSGTCLNTTTSSIHFSKPGEDEIRKERKRQSNRESAKRSRMRKQKECEELHRNMDFLKDENSELTHMLMKLSEECLELSTENDLIQEELVEMFGPESIADLLPMKPASVGSQTTLKEEP